MSVQKIKPKRKVHCQLCDKVFVDKYSLINHIASEHADQIPGGWSAARYECYLRTGKVEGKCIYCGNPTGFNEKTGKYFRICKSAKCREKASSIADKNMIGKYGKTTLLNDPDQQRKMVYSRKNSGTYTFTDDDSRTKYEVMYDSSYGLDFLEMLDNFLNFSGQDILGPSPHTYYYTYEGKTHFYIPDFYIPSLSMEIEIKDGGNNPNNHPKIQAIDKKKEELKDEVMNSISSINYIKVVNKEYAPFYALLSALKEQDIVYVPKWDTLDNKEIITEGLEEVVDTLPDPKIFGKSIPPMKILKQSAMLFDPAVNYRELANDLYAEARACRKRESLVQIDSKVRRVQTYLAKVANSDNGSAAYEARRTSRYISSKILPYIEKKANEMDRNNAIRSRQKHIAENCQMWVYGQVLESSAYSDNQRIPIYVVLFNTGTLPGNLIRKVVHEPYSHATIATDPSLRNLFSFNFEGRGFVIEDILDGWYAKHTEEITYSIYVYMATPNEYTLFANTIEMFKNNMEKFKYDVSGLVRFFSKHKTLKDDSMICSEFVACILKSINSSIVTKERNQYTPSGLAKLKQLVFIQKGILKNFSTAKLVERTNQRLKEVGYNLWTSDRK